MSRQKRTNYAKVKLWLTNMTSEVEGTIAGVAVETFAAIESAEARCKVLEIMQQRHKRIVAHESAQEAAK